MILDLSRQTVMDIVEALEIAIERVACSYISIYDSVEPNPLSLKIIKDALEKELDDPTYYNPEFTYEEKELLKKLVKDNKTYKENAWKDEQENVKMVKNQLVDARKDEFAAWQEFCSVNKIMCKLEEN